MVPRIQVCTKVITTRTGTGVQTVTGIVDHNGDAFTGRLVFFQGGNAALNAVSYQDSVNNAYVDDHGADDGMYRMATALGDISRFGLKLVSGGAGYSYSLLDYQSDIFFGGNFQGYAYVSAFRSGEFDITFDLNNRGGDSVLCVVFGGSALNVDYGAGLQNGTLTTTGAPAALFNIGSAQAMTNAGGGAATGAGGGYFGYGWDTNGSGRGVSVYELINQAGNGRGQLTDRCGVSLSSGSFGADAPYVSAWGSNSLTIAGAPSGAQYTSFAFSGTGIVAKAGTATQPTSTGLQTISLGVNAKWVVLTSVGAAASASAATDRAELAVGWTDGTRQGGFWCGETSGNTSPILGARYISDGSLLRSAAANGVSTSFDTVAEFVSLSADGELVIDWTTVDATAREILWFAIGTEVGVIEPPVSYEDPCSITEPKLYATVKTETESLKFGVQPLRDSAALGGYAEPRLVEVSPIVKVASDPSSGAWSAQTCNVKWADTDRVNRERSESRTSFRNCDEEIYLTSNNQRRNGLPPRVLLSGTVLQDSADENLILGHSLNDIIGGFYTLFGEEKQIPQRVVELNWFPNAPDSSLGQAEPIVGGRRRELNPVFWDNIEGVSKGVYVGQVRINGSHGTPTGTDLATIVAAMNVSGAAGTIYADWGSRIGYGDAIALQSYYDGHATVPADYDGLAAIIGYSDLDALLAETAHTGGDVFEAVVIASHAISEILTATNTEPSIWIGDTQVPAADIGVSVWCPQIPGDTTWASDIGSDLFTDIVGSDGVTRRYTLILFDPGSGHGTDVAGGAIVHVDCVGLESIGNGLGTPFTDYFDLYQHVLINYILQTYLAGAWLPSPQFLFSDGVTLIDRVDADTFATASTIAALNVTGGYLGSFTIGDRVSVRDIIQRFNFSGGCLLAQDDYGRLIVKVLDTRRTEFLTDRFSGELHRTLRDKVDILPGFHVEAKPEWQVNRLTYQYAYNGYAGAYERDAGGGGNTVFVEDTDSQARDGILRKTVEFAYLADDLTAAAVADYYLQLFKNLPRVAIYTRRGLCGLEDDLLDGRPITHFNGYGVNGWADHAVWVIGKTFDPKQMVCTFTALDVEGRLVQAETPELDPLRLDPVGGAYLYNDETPTELLYADS